MEHDWQNEFDSLQECNSYLLETGHRSDCSFFVGILAENRVLIKAHLFLLANASPVFERMFYGSVPENKEKAILIEDIEPGDFKNLLKFIYTREINFESTQNAQQVYYASKKYMLNKLTKICVEFLSNNLQCPNVCEIFEFAERFEECQLKQLCIQLISKKTSKVLKSMGFYHASLETLETIILQDELNISGELELFNAVQSFAKYRYSDDELSINDPLLIKTEEEEIFHFNIGFENKCSHEENQQYRSEGILKIKKLVKKLRFLTLSPNEFATGPALSNLLTRADACSILVCLVAPNLVKSQFPIEFNNLRIRRFVTFNGF